MFVEQLLGTIGDRTTVANPARWLVDFVTGGATRSGVAVNEESALTYSPVWAATCFLTACIATIPLKLYRDRGEGDREEARDHPLWTLLHDAPNEEQDSVMFWSMMAPCLINWGNAYAEIQRDRTGRVVGLWPIHAKRVKPKREARNAPLVYEVSNPDGTPDTLPASAVFHVAGWLSDDGITGKGVIRQARESIGMGMAGVRFGASFLGNDATPGLVLTHPGNPSPEATKNILDGWNRMHQGPENARRTALLREGMKAEPIGIPPEDAQFVEILDRSIGEVARWYQLPPHVLADLTRATFSNIEHQDLQVLKYSVRNWYSRIEKAIKRQVLGLDDPTLYCEFLVDALLRADSKTRTETLAQQFLNGVLTLNQWCAKENRNRVRRADGSLDPLGDEHFVPLNLVPLSQLAAAASGDPAADAGKAAPPGDPAAEVPPADDQEPAVPADEAALALREVIDDALGRMLKIETNEVRRAAKIPGRFLERLDQFAEGHLEVVKGALFPGLAAYVRLAGLADDPWDLAAEAAGGVIARFRACYLAIAGATPERLAAEAERVLGEFVAGAGVEILTS